MATARNPIATILLCLAGGLVGLILWVFCGLGMVELGLLDRFDPIGVGDGSPAATPLILTLEWAFPGFALAGAVAMPTVVRWLLRSPAEIEAGE